MEERETIFIFFGVLTAGFPILTDWDFLPMSFLLVGFLELGTFTVFFLTVSVFVFWTLGFFTFFGEFETGFLADFFADAFVAFLRTDFF